MHRTKGRKLVLKSKNWKRAGRVRCNQARTRTLGMLLRFLTVCIIFSELCVASPTPLFVSAETRLDEVTKEAEDRPRSSLPSSSFSTFSPSLFLCLSVCLCLSLSFPLNFLVATFLSFFSSTAAFIRPFSVALYLG